MRTAVKKTSEFHYRNATSHQIQELTDQIARNIVELLPAEKNLSILDVGCGSGWFSEHLSSLGHKVVGVDSEESGIQRATEAYGGHIQFFVGSAYDDLRKFSGAVDVIVSSEVIEHLYSPSKFLKNAYAALKPGGYLILSTPYHGYLKNLALSLFDRWDRHHSAQWEGGHIKFFSEKSIQSMLVECGFTALRFNNAGRFPYLWKSMIVRARKA